MCPHCGRAPLVDQLFFGVGVGTLVDFGGGGSGQLGGGDGEPIGRVGGAQEAERRRIAGDLHDDAVQVMATISMRLALLRDRMTTDADRATVDYCSDNVGDEYLSMMIYARIFRGEP